MLHLGIARRHGSLLKPRFRNECNLFLTNAREKWLCTSASSLSGSQHYGQPLPDSHSHLLHADEVSPGISRDEYKQRRRRLMHTLTENAPVTVNRHVVAMVAAEQLHSAPDVPHEFRQCADFRYLSGFQEAKSVLLMEWQKQDQHCRTTLFVAERNDKDRLWHGPRTSLDDIPTLFGVDHALPIETLRCYLSDSYPDDKRKTNMLWSSSSSTVDQSLSGTLTSHFDATAPRSNVLTHLHLQRVVKTTAELALMRKAAMATKAGFLNIMHRSAEPVGEWMLEGKLLNGFMSGDVAISAANRVRPAFPSVIAGGCRATVLHYLSKDMFIECSDMVLVDAGAEVDGYVCDLSRTWPIGGRFSANQRLLYEAVADVQCYVVDMINSAAESGQAMTLDQLHSLSLKRTEENLRSAGVIPAAVSSREGRAVTRQLFPHALGHYVGADVHDCKFVSGKFALKEGVTLTIEPGLYIPPNSSPWIPSCFHGIGIRIEDIVVINKDGKAELVTSAPKTVEEVEEQLNN